MWSTASRTKYLVDFGEVIGDYTDPNTDAITPTTKGIIHYSEKGHSHRSGTPMTNNETLTTLKLSIQRALLGAVTDRLDAVTAGISNGLIEIRAYFHGACTPEDVDRIQRVATEVIADFPEGYTIQESCLSMDEGEEPMLDFWAFRRAP